MVKENGDWIYLDVVVERYKTKFKAVKENGKYVLNDEGKRLKLPKQIYNGYYVVPTRFHKEGITMNGQTPNHRHQVQKNKSTIFCKYSQTFFVVNHKPEEIEEALNKRPQIGFRLGENR